MKWEQFLDIRLSNEYDGQVQTDIECPDCGRKIYLDTTMVLTSYPCKYRYWCSCGWHDTSHLKWRRDFEIMYAKRENDD